MARPNFHEDLSRDEEIAATPDRSIGFLFAVVFTIVALLPLLGGHGSRRWALIVAAAFFGVALIAPPLLHPLNVFWRGLGVFLHRIVNPLVMGAMFFVAILPTSVIMRIVRRDVMKRTFDRSASTYWIKRESPGTDPASMRNQY